ncbi:MAG: hypothetical protein JXA25_06045 [Anaerolineales bacterium]|nr:hypothetical protein [Anaerolineales bacterium]
MSKVLLTYATNSGSTVEVTQAVAEVIGSNGHTIEVRPISEVSSLHEYDAVVVGAPMILGWHADARRFLRKYKAELARKKTACFACAMRLTEVPGENLPDVPLMLDPNLVSSPEKNGSLSLKERFTTTGYYLKPILQAAPGVKPLNVAFFYGKLDMTRLKWWQALFVMIVVQAVPGDYRDWETIKDWAQLLSSDL